MNISVFGLGYVGAVTAGCLSHRGHRVVGVDLEGPKVEAIRRGESPIIEPGLEDFIQEGVRTGRLTATASCQEAITSTELSLVCVGTPSLPSGALDLGYVQAVAADIAWAIRAKGRPHALVFRSTMLPGTTAQLVATHFKDLCESGGLEVYFFPEFMREGTAVADFEDPSLAVVGTERGQAPAPALLEALFGNQVEVCNWATAELIKYACNAFHATKVTFANEVGRLGKSLGVDARRIMGLVCRDTRLNLSPYYMRPGNPFGGSCLPKDLRALTHQGRLSALQLPLLESLLPSNERHLQSLLTQILELQKRDVVILGLAFKSQTDDLRESAMVEVAQTLLGRGYQVRIYDPALNLSALVGSNKRLIDARMPHLATLLKPDLASAVGNGGTVVVAQRCAAVSDLAPLLNPGHAILDVNGWPELSRLGVPYHGFCW